MAGLSIRLLNANFTNFIASIDAPTRAGLVGEYYIGNNATQTQENTVDGQADGLIVGTSAIYYPYSALLKASGYLNTQLPSTAETTVVVLAKKCLVANSGNGSNAGLFDNTRVSGVDQYGVRLSSNTQFDAINARVGDLGPDNGVGGKEWYTRSTDLLSVSGGDTNFLFHFGRYSSASKFVEGGYFNATQGKRSQSVALNSGTRVAEATPIKVGMPGTGGQEIAYVAIYNRILTDQELNTIYASLRDFYIGKIEVA